MKKRFFPSFKNIMIYNQESGQVIQWPSDKNQKYQVYIPLSAFKPRDKDFSPIWNEKDIRKKIQAGEIRKLYGDFYTVKNIVVKNLWVNLQDLSIAYAKHFFKDDYEKHLGDIFFHKSEKEQMLTYYQEKARKEKEKQKAEYEKKWGNTQSLKEKESVKNQDENFDGNNQEESS